MPLLLLFGELMPKTIGIKLAERWARLAARPTICVTWLLWLPRAIVSAVADAVLLLPRQGPPTDAAPVLREEEFRALVDVGCARARLRAPSAASSTTSSSSATSPSAR